MKQGFALCRSKAIIMAGFTHILKLGELNCEDILSPAIPHPTLDLLEQLSTFLGAKPVGKYLEEVAELPY